MLRICNSLTHAGYEVELVGRKRKNSPPLVDQIFRQKRLPMFFQKGKLFYAEYNIRLLLYLLRQKADAICSIDLDSIMPGLIASRRKGWKRVYDAHELFCEMEEIISRPKIYWFWKKIEKRALPYFPDGYTVNQSYQEEFERMYGNRYEIVRNAAVLRENSAKPDRDRKYILYQGAVNEGRCFDELLEAMQFVDFPLVICGEGNYMEQVRELIAKYKLEDKVTLTGYVDPQKLKSYTEKAICGITLFQPTGQSNYLSLANRFFDYMHSEVVQLAVNLPEYARINGEFEIATLIDPDKLDAKTISEALNKIVSDKDYRQRLEQNAAECKLKYNWQNEETKLLRFWEQIFSGE